MSGANRALSSRRTLFGLKPSWPGATRCPAGWLAILLVAGCLPHSPAEHPTPPLRVTDADTDYATDESELEVSWWRSFPDDQLRALIERALGENLELEAAAARIAQAQALSTQAWAARWPSLNAEASASYQRQVSPIGGPFGGVFELTRYSASVATAYELDLFNRIGAGGRAADFDVEATRYDRQAMAVSMSAEVAERWYDLVQARARLELLNEQVQSNETVFELVKLRFERGLNSALDVHQQRQQLQATLAQAALAKADPPVNRNQLAVLLGQNPPKLELPPRDELPELSPLADASAAFQQISHRPDVQAALRRVKAADWRVGQANAARFPSLSGNASVGLGATDIEQFLESVVWSVGGQLNIPIFQGGRLSAEVNRAEAVLHERLQTYGQALLRASAEARNAWLLEQAQRENIDHLDQQVQAAERTFEQAQERYRQGLSDFLPVLTALQTLQQTQLNLLGSRRRLLSHRVQLYRAIGGQSLIASGETS